MENNSRTSNSIRNILSGLGQQGVSLIIGFVNRSVFLYFLNVDYLGIQGLFSEILTVLSLADLGFTTAIAYNLYKPLAENNKKEISGLLNFYKKIYRIVFVVVLSVGIFLIPFLKYLINLDTEIPNIYLIYVLYLLNTASSYLFIYKTCIVSADQKSYILSTYNIVFDIVQTILITVILYLTKNYIAYLITGLVISLLRNFILSYRAQKKYPYIKSDEELDHNKKLALLKNVSSAFLYKLSGILINSTDNMLISVIVGTSFVGYYSNYSLPSVKISAVINTIFYSLTASLGNLIVCDERKKRIGIFNAMQPISLMFATFFSVNLFLLLQDFIKVWLGKSYLLDNSIVLAIVVNFYLAIVLLPIWVFREAAGLYTKTKYMMLCTAFLNLLLSIILGRKFGLFGILIATALSRLLTYFWYEPILLFKTYFDTKSRVYYINLLKNLVVTIILCVCGSIISGFYVVNSVVGFIIKGFIISVPTLAVLLLFYKKTEGFVFLKTKALGLLKLNKKEL